METLKNKIEQIVNDNLNGFLVQVRERKNYFSKSNYIAVNIATSDFQINNVQGQYYNNISFCIEEDLELRFQVFGGNGGQCVYRKIDKNIEREKYLALGREKISFRTPKKEEKAILNAIDGICKKYRLILIDIEKRGLLQSENLEETKKLLYNELEENI
jgi:hypothetical protein